MKKRVNIITVVVLMALMGVATYVITFYMVQEEFNQQLEAYGKWREEWGPFSNALDTIENKYIGEADGRTLMQGAIDGMVRSVRDPWSHYFDPESFLAHLGGQSRPYVGIGVTVEPGEGSIRIVEVMHKAPAEEAGLRPGDLVTHVNGMAVAEIGYDEALIEVSGGGEYTIVTLTVERPSEGAGSFETDVMRRTVIRDQINVSIIESPDGPAGLVKILNFDDYMDAALIERVDELLEEGVTSLIFDVRDNPGGKLNVLENVLDYLLPEGDLITLRYKDGRDDTRSSGPECVNLPMAVLINEHSISAAEFFAACLREYEWAVLVGEKTGGKGYAQETIRLSEKQAAS